MGEETPPIEENQRRKEGPAREVPELVGTLPLLLGFLAPFLFGADPQISSDPSDLVMMAIAGTLGLGGVLVALSLLGKVRSPWSLLAVLLLSPAAANALLDHRTYGIHASAFALAGLALAASSFGLRSRWSAVPNDSPTMGKMALAFGLMLAAAGAIYGASFTAEGPRVEGAALLLAGAFVAALQEIPWQKPSERHALACAPLLMGFAGAVLALRDDDRIVSLGVFAPWVLLSLQHLAPRKTSTMTRWLAEFAALVAAWFALRMGLSLHAPLP